ncbi:MAG: DUF5668 domain-containing protein [Ignavibacteriaceae bacterium]|nr:DUF5668 domain-containing protein [Ignavibacteriaceae bacterium]MCW8818544.1 DUF5668 domain-containing protein [Ignavibacteriaceae bacterium]
MKTSHIFWGLLFIVFGLLVLINNFTTIFMDWGAIWKLWPLVIVLLGISIIVKHKYGKGIIAGLAAIILALAIFASIKTATHFVNNDFDITFGDEVDSEYTTTEFTEDYDSLLKFGTLNFDAGAGSFNISKTTDSLIHATATGVKNNFRLTRFDTDSSTKINLVMRHKSVFRFGKSYKNNIDVALNPNLTWDMNFDVGAASMDFDLSEFKTEKVDVDMGAAALKIKLGSLSPDTKLSIDAGASDINIYIPKESGCKITTDGALSSKHFNDFEKINSDHFETANFNDVANKIFIVIDSGVSSISVDRY